LHDIPLWFGNLDQVGLKLPLSMGKAVSLERERWSLFLFFYYYDFSFMNTAVGGFMAPPSNSIERMAFYDQLFLHFFQEVLQSDHIQIIPVLHESK